MTLYLGIDDTDTLESRGTGRLARMIAAELARSYTVTGVTRHQLYVPPSIPYTSHNSCAVIHIQGADNGAGADLFSEAKELMLSAFVEGSDPGICVATEVEIGDDIRAFGYLAKKNIVTQGQARGLARAAGIRLEGLGGAEDGVVGALAGIGLASSANDGRIIIKDATRSLQGTQSVDAILACGVDRGMTRDGAAVDEGIVALRKFPKPAFIGGKAILFVEPVDGVYCDIVIG